MCGPQVPFRNIGPAIYRLVKRRNKSVIPLLCGHGIGTFFHGPPDIYHTLNNYRGLMKPGMIFTIEPCIAEFGNKIKVTEDGFNIATLDGGRTAQFEHTILVTENGIEILTA